MACQGQLRVAPSGYVLGIDMTAALEIAGARRYDVAVVSELLQAGEAGMIEVTSESAAERTEGTTPMDR
jgi:hypothetical protein